MTSENKTDQSDESGWQFWVDRGGTFTDLVARKPNGQLLTHKLLSENPEAYEDAALQGIRDLLNIDKEASLPADTIDAVKMGTTVATNALLERKGDATLLVVTKGFRDQLRIAYQARPRLFDKEITLPEMLYDRIEEATERIDANDNIITPLDLNDLAPRLRDAFCDGIRSIAIVLMHGYRIPVIQQLPMPTFRPFCGVILTGLPEILSSQKAQNCN
jgi:5-oxoprolinase (ATP-hydrolysing)